VTAADGDALIELFRDPDTGAVNWDVSGSCLDDEDTQPGAGCTNTKGLDQPRNVEVSPDGRSIYVGSASDNTLVHFDRKVDVDPETDPAYGLPQLDECFVDIVADEDGCTDLSGDDVNFEIPGDMVVSPDGTSLYLADSGSDQLMIFDRLALPNAEVGDLNTPRCIADAGDNICDDGDPMTVDDTQGLGGVRSLAIAATGSGEDSLYATSVDDAALVRFARAELGGAIAPVFCFADNDDEATAGCTEIDGLGNSPGFLDSGPNARHSLVVSPDGRSVYTGGGRDNTISHFLRDTDTGAIDPAGCFGDSEMAEIIEVSCLPTASELREVGSLAFAGDGVLYAASPEHTITTLRRELDPPVPGQGSTIPPVTNPPITTPAKKKCKKKKKGAKKKKRCKKRKKRR
jgi:hypothetical protein